MARFRTVPNPPYRPSRRPLELAERIFATGLPGYRSAEPTWRPTLSDYDNGWGQDEGASFERRGDD